MKIALNCLKKLRTYYNGAALYQRCDKNSKKITHTWKGKNEESASQLNESHEECLNVYISHVVSSTSIRVQIPVLVISLTGYISIDESMQKIFYYITLLRLSNFVYTYVMSPSLDLFILF